MNDSYFDELRRELRGLPDARRAEIIAELEAHVAERSEAIGRAAALAVMGHPREIAALYRAGELAQPSARPPSPWRVLRAIELVGRVSLGGLFTLAATLLGYATGLFLITMALLKPFMPERIGLWLRPGDDVHFSLGRMPVPTADEVLGWWIIPLGLILGLVIMLLTWRWSLAAVRSLLRIRLDRDERQPGDPFDDRPASGLDF